MNIEHLQQRIRLGEDSTLELKQVAGREGGSFSEARVLGGGSSINGQMANRGAPNDYAMWEERGATGWGWDDVLPYFKKVEHDLDFDDEWHGQDGRIPIMRIFPDDWHGYPRALGQAAENRCNFVHAVEYDRRARRCSTLLVRAYKHADALPCRNLDRREVGDVVADEEHGARAAPSEDLLERTTLVIWGGFRFTECFSSPDVQPEALRKLVRFVHQTLRARGVSHGDRPDVNGDRLRLVLDERPLGVGVHPLLEEPQRFALFRGELAASGGFSRRQNHTAVLDCPPDAVELLHALKRAQVTPGKQRQHDSRRLCQRLQYR